jgi:hypothetical protein
MYPKGNHLAVNVVLALSLKVRQNSGPVSSIPQPASASQKIRTQDIAIGAEVKPAFFGAYPKLFIQPQG